MKFILLSLLITLPGYLVSKLYAQTYTVDTVYKVHTNAMYDGYSYTDYLEYLGNNKLYLNINPSSINLNGYSYEVIRKDGDRYYTRHRKESYVFTIYSNYVEVEFTNNNRLYKYRYILS